MASNGPDGPILSIFGPFSAFAFPFGPKNEKIGSNKAFHHYGAQGAPRVNADVQQMRSDLQNPNALAEK